MVRVTKLELHRTISGKNGYLKQYYNVVNGFLVLKNVFCYSVADIMRKGNLDQLTTKKIRMLCEQKYNIDLSSR